METGRRAVVAGASRRRGLFKDLVSVVLMGGALCQGGGGAVTAVQQPWVP